MEKHYPKFLIILVLIYLFACKSRNQKFDQALWNKRTDMFYEYRDKMINDLMKNHLQKGMRYKMVNDMLGKPENYSDLDSNMIGYEVFVDYGWDIDPIETKTLLIGFSKDSTITEFRLEHWEK